MTRTYAEVEAVVTGLGMVCTPDYAAPLMDGSPEKLYFGGWRSSKTTHECLEAFLLITDWLVEAMQGTPQRRLVWIVGPDYKQTGEEYRYLAEWTRKSSFDVTASEAIQGPREMRLRHPMVPNFEVVLETKSADRPETLASVAPDLILACESGQLSDEVRDMLRGRSGEKAAPIIWGGTVENDEGHAEWAWYQDMAREWLDNPDDWHKAWCLPSWENPLFRDCRSVITRQPTLARYCPDEDHGEAHGYRLHPTIKHWEETYDWYTFSRRIAAVPTGAQYLVYRQLQEREYLQPINQIARLGIFASAGGIDYGTTENHPSALVVVQLTDDPRDREPYFVGPRGIAWVRECIVLRDGGDATSLKRARKELSDRWKVYRWNVDPNERFMAKNFEGENTSYSESARLARHGIIRARLNLGKLFFDLDGPGIPELVKEMKLVHYSKDRQGQLHPHRDKDDRTAALEDAVEALDGERAVKLPKASTIRHNAPVRRREFVPI